MSSTYSGSLSGIELIRHAERFRDGHIDPSDRELKELVRDLLLELDLARGSEEATHNAHIATLRQFEKYRETHR